MTTNPYAASDSLPNPPTSRLAPTWHRAAWLLPLVGLGLTVMMNAMGRGMGEAGAYLGIFGAVLFMGSVVVGWILTIALIFSLLAGRGTLRHFVGGIIANGLLTLFLAIAFHATELARQAALEHRRQQQIHNESVGP